ncbi:MAG: hypothetical protein ACXAC7_21965 [Candidatus Hodarchaeales archaeon]|jgi:hypothetical protein
MDTKKLYRCKNLFLAFFIALAMILMPLAGLIPTTPVNAADPDVLVVKVRLYQVVLYEDRDPGSAELYMEYKHNFGTSKPDVEDLSDSGNPTVETYPSLYPYGYKSNMHWASENWWTNKLMDTDSGWFDSDDVIVKFEIKFFESAQNDWPSGSWVTISMLDDVPLNTQRQFRFNNEPLGYFKITERYGKGGGYNGIQFQIQLTDWLE